MQLKRLYLKEYKLFKDFTYDFPSDNQHNIHVLIGINGSGKSTILEALAEIFSCVVLGEKAKFGFELEYSLFKSIITTKVDGFQLGFTQPFDIKITSERDESPIARHR
jgi:predicted ATPase